MINSLETTMRTEAIKNKWRLIFWVPTTVSILISIPFLPTIVTADQSYITVVIIALFAVALVMNYLRFTELFTEMDTLNRYYEIVSENKDDEINLSGSIIANHWKRLKTIADKDGQLDQDGLIESIQTKLLTKGTFPNLISRILITLGLIGTIIGLVISLSGMEQTFQQATENGIAQSIQTTLTGMGTAFYTTLIGAILGGVLLRFQNQFLEAQTSHFIASLTEVTKVYWMPYLNSSTKIQIPDVTDENLDRFERLIGQFDESIDTMKSTFKNMFHRASKATEILTADD